MKKYIILILVPLDSNIFLMMLSQTVDEDNRNGGGVI